MWSKSIRIGFICQKIPNLQIYNFVSFKIIPFRCICTSSSASATAITNPGNHFQSTPKVHLSQFVLLLPHFDAVNAQEHTLVQHSSVLLVKGHPVGSALSTLTHPSFNPLNLSMTHYNHPNTLSVTFHKFHQVFR